MTQKEFQVETGLSICNCCTCGVSFAIPVNLKNQLQDCHNTFYCPNGHPLHYPHESEKEILARQLKFQKNLTESYKKQARENDYKARGLKGRITKIMQGKSNA